MEPRPNALTIASYIARDGSSPPRLRLMTPALAAVARLIPWTISDSERNQRSYAWSTACG